jgi:hypothetical protein
MARKISKKIMQVLEENDARFPSGCSEPGYDDKPVIMANWNNITAEVYDKLESMGYSCEWEDEWVECSSCYKAFRTSPDSYGWEMCGIIGDGEAICGDCLKDDPAEYLESIENQPKRALTCSLYRVIDPCDHGYKLINDELANDWNGGNDDPVKILTDLQDKTPGGRFLFVITSQGQFGVEFAVYQKIEEEA